jgi:hypothetical protein
MRHFGPTAQVFAISLFMVMAGGFGPVSRTFGQATPSQDAAGARVLASPTSIATAQNWRALAVDVHASASRVVAVVVPERDDQPILAGRATITARDGRRIEARVVHVRTPASARGRRLSAWLEVGGEPDILDAGPPRVPDSATADGRVAAGQSVPASLLIIEASPADLAGAVPGIPLRVIDGDTQLGRDEIRRAARRAVALLPDGEANRKDLERELIAAAMVPASAWRADALLDALRRSAIGGEGLAPSPARDRLAAGVLESVCEQEELLWLAAIARLSILDHDLCARVCDALVRVGRISVDDREAMLPIWAVDRSDLIVLRERLNGPDLTVAERLSAAGGFVDRQPDGVAWVIDDAGAIDGSIGTPRGLLGVSAAGAQGVRVRIALAADSSGEGVLVDGGRSATLAMFAPPSPAFNGEANERGAWARQGERQRVIVNDRAIEFTQLSRALAVVPPGLLLGPMVRDWTLETWRAGVPIADATCAALLLRDAQGRWCILVEGLASEATLASERVRVVVGPRGSPSLIIAVRPGVQAIDEQRGTKLETTTGRELASGGPSEQTTASPGAELVRWQATVVLPANVFAAGKVALGIVRERALAPDRPEGAGVLERSAWPRPMMPMQEEPGRVLVDLSAWPG